MKNLYDKYKSETPSQLSYSEFENLVIFFPTLLIVASDGVIDDEEKLYLEYLAAFMSKSINNEEHHGIDDKKLFKKHYLDDLEFLTSN